MTYSVCFHLLCVQTPAVLFIQYAILFLLFLSHQVHATRMTGSVQFAQWSRREYKSKYLSLLILKYFVG